MSVLSNWKLQRAMRQFRKDEEGSIVVLTIFLIIAMIWTAGIAVDMMRFETYRARLQSTIDRAVLAAADLDVCLRDGGRNPADVVADYMITNGFGDQLGAVNVETTDSSCEITAEARIDVNTIFMKLIGYGEINTGVQQLGTTAASGATESIDDVEISLVLDISGSMGRNSRLQNLQTAASDFVELITDTVEEDRLTMSIIPYSTQVSIGPDMMAQYQTLFPHSDSYCLDLPVTTYSTTSVDPGNIYTQAGHFDANTGHRSTQLREANAWTCNPETFSYILPWTSDVSVLRDHINAFEATDWTSVEMGANWGIAMLDPATNPVVRGLVDAGSVEARYADRPAPFNTEETLKVLVVMTDGENTRDYVLSTDYRDQWSDVWFSWNMEYDNDGTFIGDGAAYTTNLAALAADPNLRGRDVPYTDGNSELQFFVTDDEEPNDFDGDGVWREDNYLVEGIFVDHDGRTNTALVRDDWPPNWWNTRFGARQQWNDIWARFPVRTHAYNFRYDQIHDASVYYSWYDDLVTVTYAAEKDRRLDLICTAAKDEGIVIFTIGFEVTDRAAQVMSDCATSPNHFYRVDGLEIVTAFDSIANQISALRLFQ